MWAAMFPGQGSQFVGMGKTYYENFSLAKELFERASDTLHIDMKKLCFEGPESELTLTENTQPALLLTSTVMFRCLESETQFRPRYSAGHSLGEYSALVAAGVLELEAALLAVRTRGQAMQAACPVGQGAMAAVLGLSDEECEKLCVWTEATSGHAPLRAANYNSPGQIVISGNASAIEWLKSHYDPEKSGVGKKLKMIPLNVSAPFHSPLMKPAQDKMSEVLKQTHFAVPQFAIVQNTTAEPTENIETLREQLIQQVSAPVKWAQSVTKLKDLGVKNLIEFGPGKVLSGLVKKIDSASLTTFNMQDLNEFKDLELKLKAEKAGTS